MEGSGTRRKFRFKRERYRSDKYSFEQSMVLEFTDYIYTLKKQKHVNLRFKQQKKNTRILKEGERESAARFGRSLLSNTSFILQKTHLNDLFRVT